MNRSDANRFIATIVPVIAGLRAALQVYEQTTEGGEFTLGSFIWFMMPYLLCLAVWAKGPPYTAAIAAVSVALAADFFAYYSAYTGSDGQSGSILVFMPLWSTLIFCPIAIYLARDSARGKNTEGNDRAP
jgi:hypothetical protein